MRTPLLERPPEDLHFTVNEEVHVAGLHHVFALDDTARKHGWQLSQGPTGFDEVQDKAAAYDRICTEGITGTGTIDRKVLPLFGFTTDPKSVHTGWYQDRNGGHHRIVRAGWETPGAAGTVHTVVYFNVDNGGRMIPAGGNTFGYLRRVVDQPSGTLLSADSVRVRPAAEHRPADQHNKTAARKRGSIFLKLRAIF